MRNNFWVTVAIITFCFCCTDAIATRESGAKIIFMGPIPGSALDALSTEEVACVPKNSFFISSSAEYSETPFVPYRYPEGNLLRAPIFDLRYGLADNVEVQITGAAHLQSLPDDGPRQSEPGDFSIFTKWAAFKAKGKRPAIGFRWGVKLPNTSDESGLGTDLTDVFGQVIASRKIGDLWTASANAGVAILGDPTKARSQNDVLTYGLGVQYIMGPRLTGMAEVEGFTGKGSSKPESNLRVGGSYYGDARFYYFGSVSVGLIDYSPDWGVRVGLGVSFNRRRIPKYYGKSADVRPPYVE